MKKLLFLVCSLFLTFYSANSQSMSNVNWGGYGYDGGSGYTYCGTGTAPSFAERMT